MKAVILAAGVGSRLHPITLEKCKTLIEINQKAILGHIIESLNSANIKDIIICTGYKAEQIEDYCSKNYPESNFTFVENKDYSSTNNMYSFYLAKEFLDSDIILMNADLIFDKEVIQKLLSCEGSAIAVDEENYMEESMKITVDKGLVTGISKQISEEESFGCSIDIYKIQLEDLQKLILKAQKIIEEDKELNQWTEVLLDKLLSDKTIIAKPCPINPLRWFEIDSQEDLVEAEMLFNEDIQKIKDKKIFFLDRDGTLTLGQKILPGAQDLVSRLFSKDKIVYVMTNNSSKSPQGHLKNLQPISPHFNESHILISTHAVIDHLISEDKKRVMWLANEEVHDFLLNEGLEFEEENPELILITYDTEITFKKIQKVIQHINNGVPYIATHPDILCPTENGYLPDIGLYLHMIEQATGIKPHRVFGKPNLEMIESTIKKHGLQLSDAAIIGDRLYTDIKLAEETEVTSILVLSGETERHHLEFSDINADIVTHTVKDIEKHL